MMPMPYGRVWTLVSIQFEIQDYTGAIERAPFDFPHRYRYRKVHPAFSSFGFNFKAPTTSFFFFFNEDATDFEQRDSSVC